jgi:hypothetical protein
METAEVFKKQPEKPSITGANEDHNGTSMIFRAVKRKAIHAKHPLIYYTCNRIKIWTIFMNFPIRGRNKTPMRFEILSLILIFSQALFTPGLELPELMPSKVEKPISKYQRSTSPKRGIASVASSISNCSSEP